MKEPKAAIHVKIGDIHLKLSVQQARQLYGQLDEVFGVPLASKNDPPEKPETLPDGTPIPSREEKEGGEWPYPNPYYPYPVYPYSPDPWPIQPYKVWYVVWPYSGSETSDGEYRISENVEDDKYPLHYSGILGPWVTSGMN